MEVLNEWLRLTMGHSNLLEVTFGRGLDLTKLPEEIRSHLEVFCFGNDYLSEKDLEYIDAQWDSLAELHYIHRLYETIYGEADNKIKPIVSLWQEIVNPIYIGINRKSKVYLTYILLPVSKVKDNVYLETLNRNFKTIIDEVHELPVVIGIRQSTTPGKSVLYIIDETNISDRKLLVRNEGQYVGDCLIFNQEILVIIGDKITYWDRLNKTLTLRKDRVRDLSEILCMSSISKEQTVSYNVFIKNI